MYKQEIIQSIGLVVNDILKKHAPDKDIEQFSEKEIQLDIPEVSEHGDYSTNVAMQLYGQLVHRAGGKVPSGKSAGMTLVGGADQIWPKPYDLAQDIVKILEGDKDFNKVIEKIEVAGPGFINFFLSKDALLTGIRQVLEKKENYGKTESLKNKKTLIEYGQPNTHKLPHIGHLYSYIIGESISRILEFAGADIFRANYQGDIGLHVAKCLWAYRQLKPQVPDPLEERVELLQKLYQEGSRAFEEDEQAKDEIKQLNKKIYEMDEGIVDLWRQTRSWSVEYYKGFEARMGVAYDKSYFESEVYSKGSEIVEENKGKIFKDSQGAVIFEGSKYGLHDRVFMTGYGTPTYEAKDMALQMQKMTDWPFDQAIITTANEQNAYFKVVFKALELIDPQFKDRLKHIGFGMVDLKEGKMSSRSGQIIGAVDLVEQTVKAAKGMIKVDSGLSEEEKEQVAEQVGVGAVKFSFLKSNPLQNISFDIKESISKEGFSGPYLQYSYARAQSVLEKSGKANSFKGDTLKVAENWNKEELGLAVALVHFSEIIEASAQSYSPNLLANYLYSLAQRFNNFYAQHKIVGADNEELRLALTFAVGQVLKNGLELLGIESPERM